LTNSGTKGKPTKLMLTFAPAAHAVWAFFNARAGAPECPTGRSHHPINPLNRQGEFLFWGNFYFPPI
jgi:hypothetical protein